MTVLKDLLKSKKFVAMLAAIIVFAAGRLGFDLDAATLEHIWQGLMVYVGAQGLADLGKGAALAKAANDNAPLNAAQDTTKAGAA